MGKKLNKQNNLSLIKMKNKLQGNQGRRDSNKNHVIDIEEQQKSYEENENNIKK